MMPDEKQTHPPEWEYKEEFGIVSQLKQAVKATQKASEMELTELRRKLERLQYGS